ncbi:hypothetical protein BH23PLA1_BH23PLA1_18450 [soil metagenome]
MDPTIEFLRPKPPPRSRPMESSLAAPSRTDSAMMVEPQTTRFWKAAVESGLIDEASLSACWDRIPVEKRTSEAIDRRLARQVIASGRMTIWQAQRVLEGRGFALKIGKYVLMDLIGQGGMGRVYLARDTRLNRRVALKMLSRERLNNPRALARFEREAKVGAQLQHDNLVRIYDEGDAHGLRYLVMEYIEGKNVGQILAEGETLPPAVAARIGRQVALGLHHAHEKGLIHRDVNPMNILVTRDGTAKVTDLGLAIDLGDLEDKVTRDGATVGTFDYISPEQARHSRSVDARTDLYSLGCSLYHMISGRVPFPTPSLPEKLYAHQLHDAEPLTNLVPGVPPGLDAVIRTLMSKKPEDRYADALAAAQALELFADSTSLSKLLSAATESETDDETTIQSSSVKPKPPINIDSVTTPLSSNGVGIGSAVTPPESDPEIAWNESRPTPRPGSIRAASKAGPGEAKGGLHLPIDLGPELPISDTLSGVRKLRSSKDQIKTTAWPWRQIAWIAGATLAGLATLGVVVGLILPAFWGSSSGEPDRDRSSQALLGPVARDEAAFPEGQAPFAVRLRGGEILASASLQDAMNQAAAGRGEVLLGDLQEKFEIDASGLSVPGGPLTLRAARGCRPILHVRTMGHQPFLRQREGTLTLSGLTLLADFDGDSQRSAAPLIQAGDRLVLDRCVFSVEQNRGRDLVLAKVQGRGARVSNCLFRGFDRALELTIYQGGEYELSHCLMFWLPDRRPGWAVRADVSVLANAEGPSRLVIDRCSILRGGGLVEVRSPSSASPLEIDLRRCAIRTDHLLLWGAKDIEFPVGLQWEGNSNHYDLGGTNWVVLSADSPDGPEDGPNNLDSWRTMIARQDGLDDASVQRTVDLENEAVLASPTLDPKRFTLRGQADPDEPIGADPSRIGPEGSNDRPPER